jgi:class 3 adenylate cyclase/dihydrofolate reductase
MRIVVTDFITLDGVIEAPGFEEHRDGRNGWALRVPDDELQSYNRQQSFDADGFLFGRTTYQIWAAFWPTGPDVDGLKARIAELPKYVLSKTLESPDWANTIVLRGDLAEEVERLRAMPGGALLVYGSADLVNGLLAHDLVDEYRILVFPLILGSGKHLFRDGIETRYLRLVSSRTFPSGVVLLTYEREAEPVTADEYGDFRWTEDQVQSLRAAQEDRVLATILFTDIVSSTVRAAELGDRQWRALLDRHDELAAAEVARWRGQVVKSTGDGIMASFDTPTRALRCAFALGAALDRLEIPIRAGIHSGEVVRRGDDLGGMGVHIASRLLPMAGANEVVVSRTVRDLATGADLDFRPLGSVSLRGVPGDWELFAAALKT